MFESRRRLRLIELYAQIHPAALKQLRRLDPRVAEQAAHRLEIAVLLVDLHRDAVTEIVRLEHRVAHQAAVRFAESPDVLAFHRSLHHALAPLAERGQNSGVSGLMSSTSVGRYCVR